MISIMCKSMISVFLIMPRQNDRLFFIPLDKWLLSQINCITLIDYNHINQ